MKKFIVLWLFAACAGSPAQAQAQVLDQRPVEASWVKQRATTPKFEFYVQVIGSGEDRYAADAIRIVNRSTRAVFQEIRGIGGMDNQMAPDDMLTVIDANFDGRHDLAVAYSDGGSGPNSTDHFFLANRKTGQFEFHPELSALTQATINPNRTVTSSSRNGCCQHTSETFRFIGGSLTRVASHDESLSPDGKWLLTRKGELRNGKMRYATSKRRAPGR